jgi:hypothetical protein
LLFGGGIYPGSTILSQSPYLELKIEYGLKANPSYDKINNEGTNAPNSRKAMYILMISDKLSVGVVPKKYFAIIVVKLPINRQTTIDDIINKLNRNS